MDPAAEKHPVSVSCCAERSLALEKSSIADSEPEIELSTRDGDASDRESRFLLIQEEIMSRAHRRMLELTRWT